MFVYKAEGDPARSSADATPAASSSSRTGCRLPAMSKPVGNLRAEGSPREFGENMPSDREREGSEEEVSP
jgi:hypothetical protein